METPVVMQTKSYQGLWTFGPLDFRRLVWSKLCSRLVGFFAQVTADEGLKPVRFSGFFVPDVPVACCCLLLAFQCFLAFLCRFAPVESTGSASVERSNEYLKPSLSAAPWGPWMFDRQGLLHFHIIRNSPFLKKKGCVPCMSGNKAETLETLDD